MTSANDFVIRHVVRDLLQDRWKPYSLGELKVVLRAWSEGHVEIPISSKRSEQTGTLNIVVGTSPSQARCPLILLYLIVQYLQNTAILFGSARAVFLNVWVFFISPDFLHFLS